MDPMLLTPEMVEPEEGSVVVMHGLSGSAYQRRFSDGLWHGPKGALPWVALLAEYHVADVRRTRSYLVFVPS